MQYFVTMVICVCVEVILNLKDELSSAGMRPGVLSVMASGQLTMLMWHADSWDLHQQVYILTVCWNYS